MRRAGFTDTKFGGGGKARAGKNSFPPTPFLFARPSVQFGARLPAEASAQAGSMPSVLFKKGSDFVKQTHSFGEFGESGMALAAPLP